MKSFFVFFFFFFFFFQASCLGQVPDLWDSVVGQHVEVERCIGPRQRFDGVCWFGGGVECSDQSGALGEQLDSSCHVMQFAWS